MNVREHIQAAFTLASQKYPDLLGAWITISHRIGGQLPASLLGPSIQRAGELDSVLRAMEDELSTDKDTAGSDFSFHYQGFLSELWVGHLYEIFRLLKDRGKGPQNEDFNCLEHHLRLLRIPLEKHEIAMDKRITMPLKMKRFPPKEDDSDVYEYSKADPTRSHIMPSGVSRRGSVMWHVIDLSTNESFWIERRDLAERIITLFAPP